MRADRIKDYIRDFTALGLGAWGFINETLKDNAEPLLLILFFGFVLVPMPFAFLSIRSHGGDQGTATPTTGQSSSPPPSSPQPSSSPTP